MKENLRANKAGFGGFTAAQVQSIKAGRLENIRAMRKVRESFVSPTCPMNADWKVKLPRSAGTRPPA
jgi:hypothetical protein